MKLPWWSGIKRGGGKPACGVVVVVTIAARMGVGLMGSGLFKDASLALILLR